MHHSWSDDPSGSNWRARGNTMDSLQPILNWSEKCTFEGAVSVEESGGVLSPWRIPVSERPFYPFLADGDKPVVALCSGVRLTFMANADQIGLVLPQFSPGMKLDVYLDGSYHETYIVADDLAADLGAELVLEQRTVHVNLPAGDHLVEIWLDPRHRFWLKEILTTAKGRIWPATMQQKRWIHYGSSISHSQAAATPSQIWTGIAARHFNWHLTNLGFSGQCVLEPMIGRLIRDLPADLVTLKLGINTHAGRLSTRTFSPCAIGLIKLIRETHPGIPIGVISPIFSPPREDVRMTDLSMTLQEMRMTLAEIVTICQASGDEQIFYIDGMKLFGPDELPWLPDQLHPNAAGQSVMADHFIREMTTALAAYK
jgi:hypothetical protein